MLIFILFGISTLIASSPAYDPLNTYQFNRKNELLKNGKISRTPWFEWWYYKVVLPEKNKSYFFVYGVVNPWDKEETQKSTRSYVSMGSFSHNLIIEEKFKLSDFKASYNSTDVRVGDINQGTDLHFKGGIEREDGIRAQWNVSINKLWGYNAASWLTGKNITNIEWYPAQADARCSGEIKINNEVEIFENAPCYQDRNWGSLFPGWWAWVVSNHFEGSPGTSLAVGGGKPTVFDTYEGYESLSIGLKHNKKEYHWRPHDGDKIRFEIKFGVWNIEAVNKFFKIKIVASAPRNKFMDLQFVTPQGRVYHDYEALQGDLKVTLWSRTSPFSKWKIMNELQSNQAGIEYGSFMEMGPDWNLDKLDQCFVGCKIGEPQF